jgi:threonine dehydrogenase-like Zn-dependent dehydrogenase
MPREIVTTDGRSFRYREYQLPALGEREIRLRVEFAAPKHGTEAHALTGSVFGRKQWDPELRLFLPRGEPETGPPVERGIGNMVVGTVTAAGGDVARFRAGERVFGYGPVREEHQGDADRFWPLEGLSEVDAVCSDPAHVALVAVRDGNIRVGDHVGVFGLGAIGLLAVQVARVGGARRVFAVDPAPLRRYHALAHGAEAAFDPRGADAALAIKLATGKQGVDVALETSGSAAALQDAIRCLRQCGTVVHVPWGPKDASALRLDEEFHLNRPTLVGSQAVWNNPDRSHPLWNQQRAQDAAIELLRSGLVTGAGIVTPIVPFGDAAAALGELLHAPEQAIKLGVNFPAA